MYLHMLLFQKAVGGVKSPNGVEGWGKRARPRVIRSNFRRDKVDLRAFITTALLSLQGGGLAIRIPKHLTFRA